MISYWNALIIRKWTELIDLLLLIATIVTVIYMIYININLVYNLKSLTEKYIKYYFYYELLKSKKRDYIYDNKDLSIENLNELIFFFWND